MPHTDYMNSPTRAEGSPYRDIWAAVMKQGLDYLILEHERAEWFVDPKRRKTALTRWQSEHDWVLDDKGTFTILCDILELDPSSVRLNIREFPEWKKPRAHLNPRAYSRGGKKKNEDEVWRVAFPRTGHYGVPELTEEEAINEAAACAQSPEVNKLYPRMPRRGAVEDE